MCKKILRTRGWADEETGSQWAKDVTGIDGELLLVSQFTLYGRLKKPKPDFSHAAPPDSARTLYAAFVERMRSAYIPGKALHLFGIAQTTSCSHTLRPATCTMAPL